MAAVLKTIGRSTDRAGSSVSALPFTPALGRVASVTVKSVMPRPLLAGEKFVMKGVVILLVMYLRAENTAQC